MNRLIEKKNNKIQKNVMQGNLLNDHLYCIYKQKMKIIQLINFILGIIPFREPTLLRPL